MKNRAVKFGLIATIAPHIFCCGLPMVLAIIGLIAPDAAHFHLIPHEWEPFLFIFSGAMLVLSWWMLGRDCEYDCDKCGKKSHRTQKITLLAITGLFIVSLILHMISHH